MKRIIVLFSITQPVKIYKCIKTWNASESKINVFSEANKKLEFFVVLGYFLQKYLEPQKNWASMLRIPLMITLMQTFLRGVEEFYGEQKSCCCLRNISTQIHPVKWYNFPKQTVNISRMSSLNSFLSTVLSCVTDIVSVCLSWLRYREIWFYSQPSARIAYQTPAKSFQFTWIFFGRSSSSELLRIVNQKIKEKKKSRSFL